MSDFLPGVGVALALVTAVAAWAPAGAHAVLWGAFYNGPPRAGESAMSAVSDQGADVIRLPIRWASIQPVEGGPYDWSAPDTQMRLAARHGVRVLASLNGTPWWAGTTDPVDRSPHPEAPPERGHRGDYRDYLRAVVERYGTDGDFWREHPGIRARPIVDWEIHNEPNTGRFWTDRDPDAGQYADLALLAGRTIKAADPEADVIVGATASTCEWICPADFLEVVLTRPGVPAVTDAVSFHAYRDSPRAVLREAAVVRRAVTRFDSPDTPLHLTEFGWGTCALEHPEVEICVSPRRQARLLERTFRSLADRAPELRLRTAHWFIQLDLAPCHEPAEYFCDFGLVGTGEKGQLRRKPSWSAYRRFARR